MSNYPYIVGRTVRKKFGTYETEEIIANALRIFGEGFKVACEIALMATGAGLIRKDEKTIAIGELMEEQDKYCGSSLHCVKTIEKFYSFPL